MEPTIVLLLAVAARELTRISQAVCRWLAARTLAELARTLDGPHR